MKDARIKINTRFPEILYGWMHAEAKRMGQSLNEYIVDSVRLRQDIPVEPEPDQPAQNATIQDVAPHNIEMAPQNARNGAKITPQDVARRIPGIQVGLREPVSSVTPAFSSDETDWESRTRAEFGKGPLDMAPKFNRGWSKLSWEQRYEWLCEMRERANA